MVTGFTTMPDSNFFTCAHLGGLRVGVEVAVDHADAAGLRHGDGEPRLGHRVHGGGQDRDMQRRSSGSRGMRTSTSLGSTSEAAGRMQHVVEGQRDLGIVGKLAVL